MASKKEVVTQDEAQMALPAYLQDAKGGDRGREEVQSNDLVIPRLEIVQSLSPCRDKRDPAYITGAEEAMIYNNVTRELLGESVEVIPVFYHKEYNIWKDRKAGGGFKGSYKTQVEAERALAALPDGAQCEVLDTPTFFCLLVAENGSMTEVVISMTRSKAKVSRKWNSLIRLANLDSFAKSYILSTVQDQNNAGETYYNWSVAPKGYVTQEQYKSAVELYNVIKAGGASADRGGEGESGAGPVEF